jgi:hypothetical protein
MLDGLRAVELPGPEFPGQCDKGAAIGTALDDLRASWWLVDASPVFGPDADNDIDSDTDADADADADG